VQAGIGSDANADDKNSAGICPDGAVFVLLIDISGAAGAGL